MLVIHGILNILIKPKSRKFRYIENLDNTTEYQNLQYDNNSFLKNLVVEKR